MTRRNTYRRHKASGQAVVTLDGHTYYLGEHGTPESLAEYERLLAERKAQGGRLFDAVPERLSVNEVLLAYVQEHETYYRKDGRSTGELELVKLALRFVKRLYGHRPATAFRPRALKTVRNEMIDADLSRKTINRQIARIKRVFRWATGSELVPPSVYEALRAVDALKFGRTRARETEPIKPVPEQYIDAVLEIVPAPVAAMIRLQYLTGMRSGEVVAMRGCDIDRSEDGWEYVPESHKTQHYGHKRVVPLGPRAQAIVRPFLKADPLAPLFSPHDAEKARHARRRLERQSERTPSQRKRGRKRKPRWSPGACYTVRSYRRCVARACKTAEVPHWHPHQLRHNAATNIRKSHGPEAARAVLGHRSLAVTEIYAERDHSLAARVMAAVG